MYAYVVQMVYMLIKVYTNGISMLIYIFFPLHTTTQNYHLEYPNVLHQPS